MRKVFADTNYWMSLLNRLDPLHERAVRLADVLTAESAVVVTTQMVLTEFLNGFASYGSHVRQQAANFVIALGGRSDVQIVQQTSDRFFEALRLYSERLDQAWSLTDCASFAVMTMDEIAEALS